MKKTYLLSVIFVIISQIMQAQAQTSSKKPQNQTQGRIVKTYYDYAHIKLHEVYSVNSVGQKNGNYKIYDENGLITLDGNFKNGILNGTGKEYYAYSIFCTVPGEARLKLTTNYLNGELNGIRTTYAYIYEGQLNIDNAVKARGDEDTWLKKGIQVKVLEEYFTKDALTRQNEYWSNGKLKADFALQNGSGKSFYESGKPRTVFQLKEGKKDGLFIHYNAQGLILTQGTYSSGVKIGDWEIAYSKEGLPIDWEDEDKAVLIRNYTIYDNGKINDSLKAISYYLTGEKLDECYIWHFGYNGEPLIDGSDSTFSAYTSYYKNGNIKRQCYLEGGAIPLYVINNNEIDLDVATMRRNKTLLRESKHFDEHGIAIEE